MNTIQLLAIDTILPTLLGVVGLVFLAAALWPLADPPKGYVVRGGLFGIVGAGSVAVSVWLWLALLHSAALMQLAEVPAPGTNVTTTVAAAQRGPSQSAAPSGSFSASPAASLTSPSVSSAAASVAASPTAAPSSSASAAATATLVPVAAVAFQPDTLAPHPVIVSLESFEHGQMIYRSDTKQIYVLTSSDKHFKVYPDTWDESQPDLGNLTPVAGRFKPGRGFGKLWNADPDIRDALGLVIVPEQGQTAQVGGDGSSTTIRVPDANTTYVFSKDGTWSTKLG